MAIGQGTNLEGAVTSTLKAILTDSNALILVCSCTGAPPTTASVFQHGALAFRTDSGTGNQALYQNVGSTAIPSWSLLDTAGASFTLPASSTDATTTTTTSFDLTQSAVTSGNGLRQTVSGLTTGVGHSIVHATSVIASGGSLMRISSTGVDTGTTTGVLLDLASTVGVAATQFLQTYGTTTGIGQSIVVAALTTGQGIAVSSASTGVTTTGRLFLSSHSGNAGVSAVLNEFSSAAADETVIVKVTASAALAAGVAFQVSGAAITTGSAISATDLNALTSGIGIAVASSATAITGAGRLFSSVHSGVSGTSAILNEFASAAADETVIAQVTASAALAAGKAFNISVAAMTTGTALSIANADALTTGTGISLVSNSADATARNLAFVHNDHASAVGAIPVTIRNDAPITTNFRQMMSFSNGTVVNKLWMGDGATSPNTALTGTAGDWLIGGDSGKGYFCTGTTNWTAFA